MNEGGRRKTAWRRESKGGQGIGERTGIRTQTQGEAAAKSVETIFSPKMHHPNSTEEIRSNQRDGCELLIQPFLPRSS